MPSNTAIIQPKQGLVQTSSFFGTQRSEVQLSYLSTPDFLEFSLPKTHIALVSNEGTALTQSVVTALKAEGNQVVLLDLEGLGNTGQTPTESLSEISDAAIATALSNIEKQYGKVGTFIHLHPHLEFQNGRFAQHFEREKTVLKAVFLLAKHLQKPLTELGQTHRANFLTLSRLDGQLGLGKRGNVSVLAGGLNGLIKSLNLEWPSVFCRAIDIQPEWNPNTIAAHLISELHDADLHIVEVGLSDKGRRSLKGKEVKVQEGRNIQTTVSEDSVFLVSGGARGVTATCVIEMAKTFQCNFILLGRSDATFQLPEFAKENLDEGSLKRLIMEDLKAKGEKPSLPKVKQIFKSIIAKQEIDATINEINSHGGKAIYLKGDVTNISSIQANLKQAVEQLGSITGIIHGAGRLADKFIQDKSAQDFENVLSVKLDGLLTLLQSVNIHHLEHLILFSSVAGFYGNVGQTDYAMANEILSKAAQLFKTNHPKTKVSAINWGAWDAGMVSPELKKQFEAAGVSLINSQGGAAMLVNELSNEYADQAQVIIGGTLPPLSSDINKPLETFKIRRKLNLNDNPFLNHHVIQGHAVLPVVNAVGWMANGCERLYPDFRVYEVAETKLFKGIVFDGSQKEDYILELKEVAKNADQIIFDATILSEGAKLPTYHYKAKVTLVHRNFKVDSPQFQHNISGSYATSKGTEVYTNGALFHDKYFQGIEEILDWTEDQIVLSCKAPEVPLSDQGQFDVRSVNTFFADIQYQGMVIWVQRYFDGAKSLPLQTDKATIFEPIPFGKQLFVNVKIQESTEFKMVATCTVYDAEGKVYMLTEGATITVSKQLAW